MEQLGWTLIHFLWQGALIGAICALCFAVVRSPQWRYAIGLAGVAVMAVMMVLFAMVVEFLVCITDTAADKRLLARNPIP
jgi:hypothetical protein